MTEVNRERRKVQITGAANVCQPVMNCREFSTWRRLLRVTAYVIRFCRKLHLKLSQQSDTNQLQVGLPSTKEIQDAEEYGTKKAQTGLAVKLEKRELKTLSPFFDDKGVMRVGGRVDPNLLSFDGKYQALLPYDHWISTLITRDTF